MQQSNVTLFVGVIANATKCYCCFVPVVLCVCVEGAVVSALLPTSTVCTLCGMVGMWHQHSRHARSASLPHLPPTCFFIQSISICTVTLAVVVLTVYKLVYCIQCLYIIQYNDNAISTCRIWMHIQYIYMYMQK